jgi:nucleoside-diphosphate-sugar epimerase
VAGLVSPTAQPPVLARQGDVSWLEGTLSNAPWKEIEAFQPETCVHCAWTTAPKVSYDSLEHFRCLKESQAFVQRAVDLGVRRVLGVGTCIEYRIGKEPLVEDQTPLGPLGPYAESKNAMRAWLEAESRRQRFRYCWGRLFYVYGVGEHPTRLCSAMIQKLLRNEPIVLKTPQSTKDYIYVTDVVSALMLLAEGAAEGAYNIGSGTGVTIYELVQTLARLLDRPGLAQRAPVEAPDPLGYVVGDIGRLQALGWQPEYNLERGLTELISAQP